MSLYAIIDLIFRALSLAIFVRVILSWVPHDRFHPLIQWVYRITDPILQPLQGIIRFPGGLDFSPIIALFILNFLKGALFNLLFR